VSSTICAVELWLLRLALRHPLRSAHGVESDRALVVVRVVDGDGAEGWGECSALTRPTYTHEYAAGAWSVLRHELAPALLAGVEPEVTTHPMAAAALVDARVDLALRREGRNLAEALGAGRCSVPWCAVLGRQDDVGRLLAAVEDALADGASQVKLKIQPGWDTAPVLAVAAHWPNLALAVDANGSYGDASGDRSALDALDDLGLVYVEQPLPADALVASAAWAERWRTPIALDETITSPGLVDAAFALRSGSIVNVKPGRLGGITRAAATAEAAISWNGRCFVGGMLESGIGRAGALALAACEPFTLPCDLGPSARYVVEDVTEPIVTDRDGHLVVPAGPGLGVVPDRDRLADLAVESSLLVP